MNILKRDDLTPKQKLIYAVIAIKQGESDFALLSNIMIAEAVGCTPRYVSESITKMESLKLLLRLEKGKIHVIPPKGQYGMVELDMLNTTNISARAKYLYLIYCATGNDYDANIWGRKRVCADYRISNSTYYLAHKELEDNKILEVIGRASGNGIQTSNINIIIRTDQWAIKRPPSWIPSEGFDLDKWCLKNLDEEGRVQPEPAISGKNDGTEDTTQEDERMQRTLTINSNLNNYPVSKNLTTTNGSFTTPTLKCFEEELNDDFLETALTTKLATPQDANKMIILIKEKGFEGFVNPALDDEMIEKAFKAFKYFLKAIESYGQDTVGYALNIDDLNRFYYSDLSDGYTEDEIEYHIFRVVELGYGKLKKPYIGFSYAISTKNGVLQEYK